MGTQQQDLQFMLGSQHLKIFAKTMQCLGRMLDDFHIEVMKDTEDQREIKRLKLKGCTTSKTTFIEVFIHQAFFDQFEATDVMVYNKIKVKSKPCYAVFNGLSASKLAVRVNFDENKLMFHMLSKENITKTYITSFEQLEMLQPVQDSYFDFRVVAKPKVLLDALSHFSNALEDITFTFQHNTVIIKSYLSGEGKLDYTKVVSTSIRLDSTEFDQYEILGPKVNQVEITFSLKDFKSAVSYCELFTTITLNVKADGNLLFTSKYGNHFQVHFLTAAFKSSTTPSPDISNVQLDSSNNSNNNNSGGYNYNPRNNNNNNNMNYNSSPSTHHNNYQQQQPNSQGSSRGGFNSSQPTRRNPPQSPMGGHPSPPKDIDMDDTHQRYDDPQDSHLYDFDPLLNPIIIRPYANNQNNQNNQNNYGNHSNNNSQNQQFINSQQQKQISNINNNNNDSQQPQLSGTTRNSQNRQRLVDILYSKDDLMQAQLELNRDDDMSDGEDGMSFNDQPLEE